MPHAALDVGFHSHPKTLKAGNAAVGLFARALSFCADHLTDGFVDDAWVVLNGKPAEIKNLLKVGLWVKEGDGYRIVDYLVYNLSKAKVEEKSNRGRELADVRWGKRDAMRSALPNAEQNALQNAVGDPMPLTSALTDSLTTPGSESENLKEGSALDQADLDMETRELTAKLLNEIGDRTILTDRHILRLAPKAPPAAFIHTIEALQRRRQMKDRPPLQSESKYARTTLANYVQDAIASRAA